MTIPGPVGPLVFPRRRPIHGAESHAMKLHLRTLVREPALKGQPTSREKRSSIATFCQNARTK